MERGWWWRLGFLVLCVVGSVLYVIPTFSNLDPQTSKFPVKQKMSLGLDLQGGLYLVLGVDFNNVYREVIVRQSQSLKNYLKEKGIEVTSVDPIREGAPVDDPRVSMKFEASKRDAIYDRIKKDYPIVRIVEEKPGEFQLALAHSYRTDVREKTINQSIEVIRNRIDEFGVTEPTISSQGTDRVIVELPGVKEVDRAKELIGRTARLEFRIVDDKAMTPQQLFELIKKVEKDNKFSYNKDTMKFSEYQRRLNELARSSLPKEREILFGKSETSVEHAGAASPQADDPSLRMPYLVASIPAVTGEDLADAHVGSDSQSNRPNVSFSLNTKGAQIFDRTTGDHIGERLAIVLDSVIHSAPVIQGRIPGGHGQITLGRGNHEQIFREAQDLSVVLRAGALPAQLEFLEQRIVGPSLGQDSIKKGAYASMIGILLVFLFAAIYYRVSGLIAVVSLVFNVLFVLAILVGLEATLTLPGIAGIALTVGIAVDSNVVIYERIREELRSGKNVFGAVEAGFQKAFRTIVDANVTNAAGALVLMAYGTGPVKGFAVTMLIGIVTTLFTAVFVCKLMFDWYLNHLVRRAGGVEQAQLSI